MTDWVVSQGDVEKHPKFGELALAEILHSFGMDVTKDYKTDERQVELNKVYEFGFKHRSPFTGQIHTGVRHLGTARTDGRWKQFTENFKAK